jgi:hypothetical protein
VKSSDLEHLLATYGAGLEAELALLRQLKRLSAAQQDASSHHDLDALARVADERESLMSGLVSLEAELQPMRHTLASHQRDAAGFARFAEVAALHRTAASLVGTIMASDQLTLQALRDAEVARRAAAQALEMGETTLSAYRRVIAPPLTNPALVDRRG